MTCKYIKFVKNLIDVLFPIIPNCSTTKRLSKRIKTISKFTYFTDDIKNEYSDVCNQRDKKIVEKLYLKTFESKEKLENKAKAITLAITVSVTLILNLSNTILQIYEHIPSLGIRILYAIYGIIAIGEMLSAALLSAQVFLKDNIMYVVDDTKKNIKFEYKKCTIINRLLNLKRSNYIYTAYEGIRNSLIMLFGFFITLVIIA